MRWEVAQGWVRRAWLGAAGQHDEGGMGRVGGDAVGQDRARLGEQGVVGRAGCESGIEVDTTGQSWTGRVRPAGGKAGCTLFSSDCSFTHPSLSPSAEGGGATRYGRGGVHRRAGARRG